MSSIRFSALLLCAFLLPACGVKVDVSQLQFEPSTQPAQDIERRADIAPDGTTTIDVPVSDAVPPEETVTPEAPKCWEVYECIIYNRQGWTLSDKDYEKCGAPPSSPFYTDLIDEVDECMETCNISKTMDDFFPCLFFNCIEDTLNCVNEEVPPSKDCGDAMLCATSTCGLGGQKSDAECMLGCYRGLPPEGVEELSDLFHECILNTLQNNPECLPAAAACYQGSGEGDKSCLELLNCLNGCSLCAETPPDEPSAGDEEKCYQPECLNSCLFGMSDKASSLLLGFDACRYDADANVFACLSSYLQCLKGGFSGGKTCVTALEQLYEQYVSPLPLSYRYAKMLQILAPMMSQDVQPLIEALDCLAKAWENQPGWAVLPDEAFFECGAQFCGP